MHSGHDQGASQHAAVVAHTHDNASVHHDQTGADAAKHAAGVPTGCSMRGVCDGPMAALFSLLSNHGILPEAASMTFGLDGKRAITVVDGPVKWRFQPPDPPPPRT
jgi:hypothetical protein